MGRCNPDSRESYKQFFVAWGRAFPDMRFTIDLVAAGEDEVTVWFTIGATHRGPFMGLEATGRPVLFTGKVTYRMADGRIAETWLTPDTTTLLRQFGVPADAQAA
jgi:predicted ester cyclase